MEIRKFRPQDIDAVYSIQQAAYRPLYEKYRDDDTNPYMESRETVLAKYMRPGTAGYVFWIGSVPVGAVRVITDASGAAAKISALAVHPGYQGRGIAQQALAEIEKLHGSVTLWKLDTLLQEAGNCHLYEKLGYRRTGRTEQINELLTLVYYEKQLM